MNASHLVSRTAPGLASRAAARTMATTFDGDMARLYLNFFDQAESAWDNTKDVVADAIKSTDSGSPGTILDVASGPGSPG